MKEDRFGANLRLIPLLPWKTWNCKLAPFERALLWPAGASLFVDRSPGRLLEAPNVGDVCWAAFRIMKNA